MPESGLHDRRDRRGRSRQGLDRRWALTVSTVLFAVGACSGGASSGGASSGGATPYEAFVRHQVPINNQLMTELSDGSPNLQFNWPKIGADEVRWLNDHPSDPCYEHLYSIWIAAMKELAGGANPGTGEATGQYLRDADGA